MRPFLVALTASFLASLPAGAAGPAGLPGAGAPGAGAPEGAAPDAAAPDEGAKPPAKAPRAGKAPRPAKAGAALTPVGVGEGEAFRYGYIDATGTLRIPARFEEATRFSEGLAAVLVDGQWGYVDTTGTIVIAPRFGPARPFSEGRALVSGAEGWCYIDHTGACALSYGDGFYADEVYDQPGDFSDGLAAIPVNNPYTGNHVRYIDLRGRERMELLGTGGPFTDGVAVTNTGAQGGAEIINAKGLAIAREVYTEETRFSEGMLAVWSGPKRGYLDRRGKLVIPAQFDQAGPFSEGLAAVEKDGKVGWIDKRGETVIPFVFEDGGEFSEGLAPASLPGGQKWGYIDRTGQWVVPAEHWGAAAFQDGLGQLEVAPYEYRWVDTTGTVVWPKP